MKDKAKGDLAVQTWDALKGAFWPIFLAIADRTREAGMTSAQMSLLFVLETSSETLTPLGVARRLEVTPATITGTLNPLEEKGLIERIRGEAEDRRVVRLRLTAKGHDVVRRWMGDCRLQLEASFRPLSAADQRALIALLGKVGPPNTGVPARLATVWKKREDVAPRGGAPQRKGASKRKKAP